MRASFFPCCVDKHKTTEDPFDRAQRKFILSGLKIPPTPFEDADAFVRRRGRIAKAHALSAGLWSRRHCQRVKDWHSHLHRDRNMHSIASRFLRHHDFHWFLARRLEAGSASLFAGRTRTRNAPGGVATRWHDGHRFASEWLREAPTRLQE